MSPNLPSDAGPALQDLTKAHLALITDKKNEAQRENDLIYNAVLPSPETLPQIDKATVATPITIQEVYASTDVQKVIGVDLFIRLIPLSVHESASVYSEEKAKLVRGEVEKADNAEVEVKSALDALGIKQGLARYRAIVEGGVGGEAELPVEVRRWKEDIAVMEERESVDSIITELTRMKDVVRRELDSVSRDLDAESRECEAMRVKYDHLWTQAPSAALTKTIRQDLKAHLSTLDAAAQSDEQVIKLWDSVKGEIALLLSPEIEDVFRASTERGGAGSENLLDLDIGSEARDDEERVKIGQFVDEIEERLGRLNKIQHERGQVLKDLKDKVRRLPVVLLDESLTYAHSSLGATRRRLSSAPAEQTEYGCGDHTIRRRTGEVPSVPAAPGCHRASRTSHTSRAELPLARSTRSGWTWPWGKEVGGARETQEGHRSSVLSCSGCIHGSPRWTGEGSPVLHRAD